MIPPIHREHFEAWLDGQPEDRTFDFWCNECVFGSFLKEHYRADLNHISMCHDSFLDLTELDMTKWKHPLPEWFIDFSLRITEQGRHGADGYPNNNAITMAELRETFNLPAQQPSPFTMVKEGATP